MNFKDMLLSEDTTVKQVAEKLESLKCKVVYVVKGKKLVASVSDGDLRRYLLKEGSISDSISQVANYAPVVCKEYEQDQWEKVLQQTEMSSVPLINLNGEVTGIVFWNGTILRDSEQIDVPIVMMAGGKGTRLYPYTKILPKALIPIGDIPIAEHIFNKFHDCGCRDFYLIVNHKRTMIQSYFDNIEKDYSVQYIEEKEPLGTGGGLSLLKGKIERDFILTNCDILIDADFSTIYKTHQSKGNFITVVLSEYISRIPYGVVDIDDDNNYQSVAEKPSFRYLINTGVYIVNSRVIDELSYNVEINFPDIVEQYKKSGEKIGCYIVDESAYMDMGQLEELEEMKKKWKYGV